MTPETEGAWGDVLWWRNRLDDPCFVYVIRAGGPIKVGVAKDVAARLATLQTGNPYRFELLTVLPGAHDLEWQLHDRIKDDRTNSGGEWFDGPLIPDFLEFVAELSVKMQKGYADDGHAPPWKRHMGQWRYKRTATRHHAEVTVRYVEPDPVPLTEEMLLARERSERANRILARRAASPSFDPFR